MKKTKLNVVNIFQNQPEVKRNQQILDLFIKILQNHK